MPNGCVPNYWVAEGPPLLPLSPPRSANSKKHGSACALVVRIELSSIT